MALAWILLGLAVAGTEAPPPGVDLVIQTDSRGELQPCKCPGMPVGGLSRRNQVFKRARTLGRPTIVLEGGDFLPDPDDSLAGPLTSFLPELLPLMEYDAMGLGERELFRGPEYVRGLAEALPVVCANVTVDGAAVGEPVRWFDADGKRVAVTGFLDPLLFYSWPGAFEEGFASLFVGDPVEALTGLRGELDTADVVVALGHAELDRILEWGPDLGFVDVIVQTHEPGLAVHPGRAGEVFVVEPGPRSRQVVRARVAFDGAGDEATPRGVSLGPLHVWDLKRTRHFDSRVEDRIRAFLESLGSR